MTMINIIENKKRNKKRESRNPLQLFLSPLQFEENIHWFVQNSINKIHTQPKLSYAHTHQPKKYIQCSS